MKTRFTYLGVVAVICVLSGCSAPNDGLAETTPGVPEGLILEALEEGPVAGWIERGETFAIVTWGSGSCPPVASDLTTVAPDRIAVTFAPSPNDPCSADMSPTTHEFALPDKVTGSPVVIEVGYEDWPESTILTLE